MKKIGLLLLSMLILTFFACKKDEITEDDGSGEEYSSKGYIPLKVGSYWIYQTFRESSTGSDSALVGIDSSYISGTLNFRSKKYYVFEGNGINNSGFVVRDSLGYLIDTLGNIIMSESNFTDTISSKTIYSSSSGPALYHISRIMYNEHKQITEPAGSFSNCIEARDRIKVYYPNVPEPRLFYFHNYYAKNIGLIEYNYRYASSSVIFKVKLVRYYIPS